MATSRRSTLVSLSELLFDPALDGAVPFVHFRDDVVTRDAMRARATTVASSLAASGVARGDAVAVRLPNGPDAIAALFGVWHAGAVHVPLNPRATEPEIDRIVAAVDPKAMVGPGLAVTTRPSARRYDDGVALVQFTSGTTGPPKPVPLLEATVLGLLDAVLESIRGGRSSSGKDGGAAPMPNLVPVSLSLWAGIYQVLFAARVGAPIVLMESFDTVEFARLVDEHAIRSTVLPPAAMTMLVDDDRVTTLAPLRYVRSISAPLSPFQARRFVAKFGVGVLNGYGQTELGGEVIGWSAADLRTFGTTKLGAVGRLHAGVDVQVIDGELWIRTPATDGPQRTGDLGRVDDDGFVWVDGRVSDMINRGGLKVHPAEVEEVLRTAPGVVDAAVVGVADDRLGEVPCAFVVLAPGAVLDPGQLEAVSRAHLAPYKVPARFVAVDALPRNEAGKVQKRDLTP